MLATLLAAPRVIHLAPSVAVTAIAGVLGAILINQAGGTIGERWWLTLTSVAGSQVFIGATNDIVDRIRDTAAGRVDKPLATGVLTPNAAAWIASVGLAAMLASASRLGAQPLALSATAVASATIYNLFLSRTPLSPIPYLVSFSILPLWIASGVGVPLDRLAGAVPLAGAFAVAAHLANALRDFDGDRRIGSRTLAQVLGRRATHITAWALAMAVGLGVGVALLISERGSAPSIGLGVVGLLAVATGATGERRLWTGMLLAAVCWTAAWALATA